MSNNKRGRLRVRLRNTYSRSFQVYRQLTRVSPKKLGVVERCLTAVDVGYSKELPRPWFGSKDDGRPLYPDRIGVCARCTDRL